MGAGQGEVLQALEAIDALASGNSQRRGEKKWIRDRLVRKRSAAEREQQQQQQQSSLAGDRREDVQTRRVRLCVCSL